MFQRRCFLKGSLVAGAATLGLRSRSEGASFPWDVQRGGPTNPSTSVCPTNPDWAWVRSQFNYDNSWVQASNFLFSSHPRSVRDAINRYRDEFDFNPKETLSATGSRERRAREAVARIFGSSQENIALTQSTTMGHGLFWNGIKIRADQEVLVSEHDHPVMYGTIELRQRRTPFTLSRVLLHQPAAAFSTSDIVQRVQAALTPRTRILALTWVHSSTGVRLPIAEISALVQAHNRGRSDEEKTIFFVDGVHGLAAVNATFEQLGCDFFVAGTHKWCSGPRGTGVAIGTALAWAQMDPTFVTFSGRTAPGPLHTPGGFADYEHRWAMAESVEFLECVGLDRIQNRIADLCTRFKTAVQSHSRIRLYTPMDPAQSAGIVCFDILGMTAPQVVEQLRLLRILATQTPYTVTYPRVSFSMFNNEADVDATARAVLEIANRP